MSGSFPSLAFHLEHHQAPVGSQTPVPTAPKTARKRRNKFPLEMVQPAGLWINPKNEMSVAGGHKNSKILIC